MSSNSRRSAPASSTKIGKPTTPMNLRKRNSSGSSNNINSNSVLNSTVEDSLASVSLSPALFESSNNHMDSTNIMPDVPVIDYEMGENFYGFEKMEKRYEDRQSESEDDDEEKEGGESIPRRGSFWKMFESNRLYFRKNLNFFILLILIAAVACAISFSFGSRWGWPVEIGGNSEQTLRALRSDVHQFLSSLKFLANGVSYATIVRLERTFLFVTESLVNETAKFPLTMLVVGPTDQINSVSDWFGSSLMSRYWPGHRPTDIRLSSATSRKDVERKLINCTTGGEHLLILRGIDEFRDPLLLHSLADPESSPLYRSLIFLTARLGNGEEGGRSNDENNIQNVGVSCLDRILRRFLDVWRFDPSAKGNEPLAGKKAIGVDQIYPIFSRISTFAVCLDDD